MAKINPYTQVDNTSSPSDQEEIRQLLGYPPSWTLRWGITIVLIAALIFLGLGWLVNYPDVVQARVLIVTESPPVRLVARSDGRISRLMVQDRQTVRAGQRIALLENTARLQDVERLEGLMAQIDSSNSIKEALQTPLGDGLKLGELQRGYARLQQRLESLRFFEGRKGDLGRISSLEKQILYLDGLNTTLEYQQHTLSREVEIAQKSLNRNRKLFDSHTISEIELEQSETTFLQYRRQLESLQEKVLDNKLQVEQFRSEILRLRQGRSDGSMENWLAAREALQGLKGELEQWKLNYLITSPISGNISLSRI